MPCANTLPPLLPNWACRCLTIAALPCCGTGAAGEPTAGEKLFALHVSGLLQSKCVACHSAADGNKLEGGLDLTSRESLLAGGDSGSVLAPGDAHASLLYVATTWTDPEHRMPPKEAERLTETETGQIRDWIEAGAPWPDAATVASLRDSFAGGVTVATTAGLSEEWTNRRYREEDLWAYQPLAAPALPEDYAGNPVDFLVDAALSEAGQPPAPPADARTLIRRMTFGLTGLPPSFEEVEAFVAAHAENAHAAVAALADTLLQSAHYGEHFARHWLDVVRYADSAGFANDFERPNAWRYRDYVVRSFNSDKPYDAFIREQIAGDEIDPSDPENLIATGFLRMGAWEHTGMSVFRVTRQQWLDDVTDSVGQTFLAHALQCARCHDHKFDPVPTADYYRMQAVFVTTQFAGRDAAFLEQENTSGFDSDNRLLQGKLAFYRGEKEETRQAMDEAERTWCREQNLEPLTRSEALARRLPEQQIPPSSQALYPELIGRNTIASKNLVRLGWERDRYLPYALSVYNGNTVQRQNVASRLPMPADPFAGGELERCRILTGGDPFAYGEEVTPGVLSAIPGPDAAIPLAPAGRRLALAQWIASEENSLTARVMANRVWSWHFGQGLAGNPNNFGATGKKPTHPELLDFLAAWFIDNGWSVKKLSRLIVTSQAYRRSSARPQAGAEPAAGSGSEPAPYAAFQPRRLAAEELRDAMLAASAELNRSVGGIPARPDIHPEVALQPRQVMGTYAPAYEPDPLPEQRNRRTLYARKLRGLRDPLLEMFNQPSPEKSCELRETSTVAPQALALLNGQETWDRALAFAHRVHLESSTTQDAVRRIFAIAYGRPPAAEELAQCLDHLEMVRVHESTRAVRTAVPEIEIVRSAVDEKSGTPFDYREKLPVYAEYVPDLQPDEVDTGVRCLANLCLVVFNSNEFLYLY